MTADKDTFLTNQRQDYKWPYSKPLTPKASQPPARSKPTNSYVAKLIEPYCHCDAHAYAPTMGRYKLLAEKEKILYKELAELNVQMAELSGELLDHPCDTDDEKMITIYQTDFVKRGFNLMPYRKLMPAIDSPVGVPVKSVVTGLQDGYRDPTMFRYTAILKPFIDVCPDVTFISQPTPIDDWFAPRTGRSEYQETIGKMGLSIIKAKQQYKEPLPSSRRRTGDQCSA